MLSSGLEGPAMCAGLRIRRKRGALAPQGLNYVLQALREAVHTLPGGDIPSVLKNWALLEWETPDTATGRLCWAETGGAWGKTRGWG